MGIREQILASDKRRLGALSYRNLHSPGQLSGTERQERGWIVLIVIEKSETSSAPARRVHVRMMMREVSRPPLMKRTPCSLSRSPYLTHTHTRGIWESCDLARLRFVWSYFGGSRVTRTGSIKPSSILMAATWWVWRSEKPKEAGLIGLCAWLRGVGDTTLSPRYRSGIVDGIGLGGVHIDREDEMRFREVVCRMGVGDQSLTHKS
jgi:hypothetical protein